MLDADQIIVLDFHKTRSQKKHYLRHIHDLDGACMKAPRGIFCNDKALDKQKVSVLQ